MQDSVTRRASRGMCVVFTDTVAMKTQFFQPRQIQSLYNSVVTALCCQLYVNLVQSTGLYQSCEDILVTRSDISVKLVISCQSELSTTWANSELLTTLDNSNLLTTRQR